MIKAKQLAEGEMRNEKSSTTDLVVTDDMTRPDQLNACLLKELSDVITGPLTILFNLTIKTGKLPADRKKDFIMPIFKKGSCHIAANYRSIDG